MHPQLAERVGMPKTRGISNVTDREGGCGQFFFRFFNQFIVGVLLCALAGQCFACKEFENGVMKKSKLNRK